ncbi:MAG: hypothetical protein A2X05_12055 [Bacteroidetes bacterium GWE2_41_25]|nr:MAG: hypothetical protein A2X05_12055 [Bacteroidetes bacterium GWE2_41_25]OFY61197.1 MAG: hypothetical protein A2X04_05000 [Bacteroidetes bacterium GWF2_41_9]HAM10379.1 hypothetical protein [Bacteroidales bacterium]
MKYTEIKNTGINIPAIIFGTSSLGNLYKLLDKKTKMDIVRFISDLRERGITIINSAVFNGGFLIGGDYFDYRLPDKRNPEDWKIFRWRESFFKICDQHHVSPSHACISFGMSHPAVSSIALNTSNPGHVKRNVGEVENVVSSGFFTAMKENGLIDNDYPFV